MPRSSSYTQLRTVPTSSPAPPLTSSSWVVTTGDGLCVCVCVSMHMILLSGIA